MKEWIQNATDTDQSRMFLLLAWKQASDASDPAELYIFTYDFLGRATQILASVTGMSDSVLLGQQFDASRNRTQLNVDIGSAVDSTTSYLYDARNRMIEILQNQVGATDASAALADKRIQFGYDPAGRINRIDRFDGAGATNPVISSNFQRDGLGRLIGLDHYDTLAWQADLATSTTPAVGGSILANYHFAFDLASQMTSMLSGLDGLSQYHYNSTAQLVGIETTDSTLPDQTFAFDDNGNRTDPETIVGVNNRLLQNADFNYVYDAEDRLVERHSRTDATWTSYTWDHRGRLVSVAHYDVDPVSGLNVLLGHVTYQYDVFNRPVSSFSAEGESNSNPRQTHRIYDGQHLLLRFVDGELANRYLHGPLVDQLLVDERVDTNESLSRWVLTDHQGTVRDLAVRDASTDEIIISNHRVFDAFGNLLSETAGGESTIFGYAGREWEEVADLQFNRARWYDPTIGRWISQDPIGFAAGDANLYRYVG
ncbi:MAG TPA: hypothetical protein DDZ51_31330, partial [Planctomycetaceae bacterium]|nr:hypothetical protein [Planctomycetaceae bacterium]